MTQRLLFQDITMPMNVDDTLRFCSTNSQLQMFCHPDSPYWRIKGKENYGGIDVDKMTSVIGDNPLTRRNKYKTLEIVARDFEAISDAMREKYDGYHPSNPMDPRDLSLLLDQELWRGLFIFHFNLDPVAIEMAMKVATKNNQHLPGSWKHPQYNQSPFKYLSLIMSTYRSDDPIVHILKKGKSPLWTQYMHKYGLKRWPFKTNRPALTPTQTSMLDRVMDDSLDEEAKVSIALQFLEEGKDVQGFITNVAQFLNLDELLDVLDIDRNIKSNPYYKKLLEILIVANGGDQTAIRETLRYAFVL